MPIRKTYGEYNTKYFMNVHYDGTTIKTSGTSGEPKEIFQPHYKSYANNRAAQEVQGITHESVVYTCLSPERAGGLYAQTIPAIMKGADVDLDKFSAYEYVRVADKYTHTHLTPKQAKAVMLTKGFKTLDLTGKVFLVGSEPVTYDIIEAFLDRGAIVITIWGMTEIGVNAILHRFETKEDLEKAKVITPPNATILGDIIMCETMIDSESRLWVKGNMSVHGDTWYNTKDLVCFNEGMLFYLGRDGTPVDFNNPRKG